MATTKLAFIFYFVLLVSFVLLIGTAFLKQEFSTSNAIMSIFENWSRLGDNSKKREKAEPEKAILVLAWSKFHAQSSWETMDPPLFKNCPPDLNCNITEDRQLLNESDAVIFHMWKQLDDPPPFRRSDQYFVFAVWEPPSRIANYQLPDGYFNLTMSHRKDSDVPWPYGSFRRKIRKPTNGTDRSNRSMSEIDRLEEIVKNKTKIAAQLTSRCTTWSKRELIVKELQKQIDTVDMYGECGDKKCADFSSRNRNPTALGTKVKKPCDDMLTRDYKFYLSFDSSLCKDYVTEKFFERMDNALIVPIVMERRMHLNLATADKAFDRETVEMFNSSFIAADDFDNVRQLADYLKYLDKNTTAYLKYFDWRQDYEVIFEEEYKPGCELCRIFKAKKKRVFQDLNNWWSTKAECHEYKQRKPN